MPSAPRMTQPQEMKTKTYVYGVDRLNGYDAWSLFEASAFGDAATAKALIAKDQRLVNAQYWYQFPIHLAVYAGRAEIVRLLLDHGADPGQSIYTYNSWDKLLHCAKERGNRPIELLLRQAMKKKFNFAPEFDLLKQSILERNARKVGEVLRRQPNLARASDALGNNALHWTVITRQLGLIERFVALGTPIDARRADGQTPVLLAVNGATDYWYRETRGRSHPSLRNTSVIVGSLLAHGASYSISIAAAVGDQERVELLLKKDPGLATRLDSARISPLSYASREGYLHIVRLLLAHGADPNTPEDAAPQGRALFEACCRNHLEVARLLLEHGAEPNAGTDSNGCCLTICEVYHGDNARPLQHLLRHHGAFTPPYNMSIEELKQAIREGDKVVDHDEFLNSVMNTNDRGLLDLYLSSDPAVLKRIDARSGIIIEKPSTLVRSQLARGLDPNQTDWLGRTFLHACAEKGNLSLAAILLDAGADINSRQVEFQGTPLAAAVRACGPQTDPSQSQRLRRMVAFLLKRGAATNLPGDQPWATPLAWATRYDNSDLVELLQKYGAM